MRELFPFSIHSTPFCEAVITIMRCKVTNGTWNTKGIFTMLADDGGRRKRNKLLTSRRRGQKRQRWLTTMSFKTRAFKAVAFNGDTRDDDVEKGIRRGRRLKISGAIEVVLGTLGEELLEMRPDSIHRKIANEEMDHFSFLESDSHGDEARSSNLELADVLVQTCKILQLHVGDMRTEVKLGSNVNTTIEGLEGGPNVAGSGRFSTRDDGGDNGGNATLNNVLNLCILLPPFTMSFEGGSISSSSDDRCGYYRMDLLQEG